MNSICNPLHHACNELRFFAISECIVNGCDVNQMDDLGETPLSCVISHSYHNPEMATFCVSMLLLAGADPNVHTKGTLTPLMLATIHQNLAIYRLLMDAGADPNILYKPAQHILLKPGSSALSIGFQLDNDASFQIPFVQVLHEPKVFAEAFAHCSPAKQIEITTQIIQLYGLV
jgi:ankyrin repeat protein